LVGHVGSMQGKANPCAVECAVADLRKATWNPESFDYLKIPQDTKRILLSLATTRLGLVPTVPFDDFIKEKGRGIIILLQLVSSPPSILSFLTSSLVALQASVRLLLSRPQRSGSNSLSTL
jgi:hypothetical protein